MTLAIVEKFHIFNDILLTRDVLSLQVMLLHMMRSEIVLRIAVHARTP